MPNGALKTLRVATHVGIAGTRERRPRRRSLPSCSRAERWGGAENEGELYLLYPGGSSAYGGARGANGSPVCVDSPRCVRIRRISAGSSIVASTTIRPPHRGHASMSVSRPAGGPVRAGAPSLTTPGRVLCTSGRR